jgi:HEAT repeat protein
MAEERSRGGGLGIFGVFSNYALARVRSGKAVIRLVSALGSDDEETSMAAYMALVNLSSREAVPKMLLAEAAKGHETAAILQVLGDVGDPGLIPALEVYTASEDAKVADAARESIEALREAGPELHE